MNATRVLAACLLAGFFVVPARGNSVAPTPADLNRALALAQAGVLDAETQLKAYFPLKTFDPPANPRPYKFWGADQTETLEPPAGTMLENAVNPSFAVEQDGNPASGSPAPRLLRIGGALRGISGVQGPATYATNGDHYALRVSDLSGRIYVNDGVDGGPTGSVTQNLRRILNILGTVLSEANLGDRIVNNRPAGGYTTLSDLVPALGSDASYVKVRDFLTAHAWVDPNVANPVPLSSATKGRMPVQYYRGTPELFRAGGSMDSDGIDLSAPGPLDTIHAGTFATGIQQADVAIYGLDTLAPQWIEIVGRAPVNVNAARKEVLVALLAGLQGWYVSERKRNNPRWSGDLFLGFKANMTFRPGMGGSEYGYLMETWPIALPGGMGISPYVIADEIIACRERKASAYFNYATAPWSGPFRNWSQFNLFIDNLVTAGVLDDPRPNVHYAYEEEGTDGAGFGAMVLDNGAKLQGIRAIAAALKANFNPNLHLNEFNPDNNLHQLVDKTDLFVNSTEFCFVPTGYFEVESLGRVVRPADGQTDAFLASDNQLVAQAKLSAVLKLYELNRQTNQKQFYAGTLAAQTALPVSSNGNSLEIGPEPDNGVFPGNLGAPGNPDNEWGGYIALPTVGSVWHGSAPKAKNTLATTLGLPSTPQFNAGMHAHFTLDSDLCDHPFDRHEIAGLPNVLVEKEVFNWPDRVPNGTLLPYGGPYDPTKGDHRLAKSFRITGGAPPTLTPFVSSDLRLDGLYAERHCAPAYYMHKGTSHFWDWNGANAHGMVSFWFKPSFYPERTGKIRKLWDMTRYHDSCGSAVNVSPFEFCFWPVQYDPNQSEYGGGPKFWSNNIGKFEPCSLWFGSKQWHFDSNFTTGSGHQFGKITKCLNHLEHASETPGSKPSPLRAHRWMNATFSWALNGVADPTGNLAKLYLNGTENYSAFSQASMTGFQDGFNRMNGFDKHSGGAYNHMRIGGTSRVANAAVPVGQGGYRGNYSSDVTIDELYVWKTETDAAPDLLWTLGRYYNVRRETTSEGVYTSQSISLPPAGGGSVKVLGASWTWYGEESDPATGDRVLYDYSGNAFGLPNGDLQPRVRLSLVDGGMVYGPLTDDGYSPVLDLGGQTPVIGNPAQVKYRIGFSFGAGSTSSILLASPVLDDVTLYWSDGAASTRVDTQTPLLITGPGTAALPDAAYGVAYTQTFTAAGAAPVTWTVSGGALPGGLTLNSATGVLSGSPTEGGTFTFVVTATTGSNSSGVQYTLAVTGAPSTGGGGGGGGGCGLLGGEAVLLLLLLRSCGHASRKAARL